jgi:hypothetical protein
MRANDCTLATNSCRAVVVHGALVERARLQDSFRKTPFFTSSGKMTLHPEAPSRRIHQIKESAIKGSGPFASPFWEQFGHKRKMAFPYLILILIRKPDIW